MKHAVILAHPRAASFNASIARTCVEQLARQGETAILRDLYAMDFDPRLRAEELALGRNAEPAPDVAAERALLEGVDSFIFVYPFWFNAPPAILKGYVDRVFSLGFGYGDGRGGVRPLLEGKSLLSVSTSGAPDHWVNSTGALKGLMQVFDFHLGAVCGLKVLDHQHFGGIVPNMTAEAGADILAQVEAVLKRRFSR